MLDTVGLTCDKESWRNEAPGIGGQTMKVTIFCDERYPVYGVYKLNRFPFEEQYGPWENETPEQVYNLSIAEYKEYMNVMKQYEMWQKKLRKMEEGA